MTQGTRILILDDEPAVCRIVVRCLEPGGYEVHAVQSSRDLWCLLRQQVFDLVILDLNLRGEDGLTVLNEIRRDYSVRTIILTARGETMDRVVGLEMGADDYVPKPFEPRELLARVRSVLRRPGFKEEPSETLEGPVLAFDGLVFNPDARQLLSRSGQPIALAPMEFDILRVLAMRPNRALTRDQIMTFARDKEGTGFDRSVDVHIGHLRRKIEKNPKQPVLISTVHGVGYIFTVAVEKRFSP
jgi:two-component system OmpR family response regulator